RRNDPGDNGTAPGGGGGGGEARRGLFGDTPYSGGNGANGRVIITYTIVLSPTITSFSPTTAVCPGDTLTINGTNLSGASVTIGGTAATITSNTATSIMLTVGSGTTGVIEVTTAAGSVSSSGTLTVNTNSIAPTTISGTNTICSGNSTSLTANGGTAGTGATLQWFSGSCSGTSVGSGNSISVSPTATTTYYAKYVGTCNTTTCAQITVTVESPVATAGAISGDITVCQGDTGVVYTIPVLPNASSYTWSLPPGATIVSGANTNSITVDYNASATTGNVSVFG